MSQESIQVPNGRVHEIFQGKASAAIKDLMLENAQLTAALETVSKELNDSRLQVRKYQEAQMEQRASSNGLPPGPPSPQDTSV